MTVGDRECHLKSIRTMNLKLQNDRHKNLFVWRKFAVGLVQEVDNDTAEKSK